MTNRYHRRFVRGDELQGTMIRCFSCDSPAPEEIELTSGEAWACQSCKELVTGSEFDQDVCPDCGTYYADEFMTCVNCDMHEAFR